ncbi:hypothetical protein [Endozoicomonas sp. G2_1]|nr:hypothetical protein [Endozoicomonas sp. G2_1]
MNNEFSKGENSLAKNAEQSMAAKLAKLKNGSKCKIGVLHQGHHK